MTDEVDEGACDSEQRREGGRGMGRGAVRPDGTDACGVSLSFFYKGSNTYYSLGGFFKCILDFFFQRRPSMSPWAGKLNKPKMPLRPASALRAYQAGFHPLQAFVSVCA